VSANLDPGTKASTWDVHAAEATYGMKSWSDGFFFVNDAGHVAVRPLEQSELSIDVTDVLAAARQADVTMPMLVRFQDVLRVRVRRLNQAFRQAIAEMGYEGTYRTIYPVKVNQLREVVEEVLDAGSEFDLGLESGSKSELIAALPLVDDSRLLLCNGVKDQTMLSLMLNAQLLGQQVLPVIEKYSEYEQLLVLAERLDMQPRLGVRVKLSTRGSGRWFESGGSKSKFGLTIPEVVTLVRDLEARGFASSLELLHFHVGSQIADIRVLRKAVREITQIYADLRARGMQVGFVDVGGGLGVNYGGDPGDDDESSVNYTLGEYANAVVSSIKEICDERDVPAPTILSESGRAITAHHSMLIIPVLGVHRPDSPLFAEVVVDDDSPGVLVRMQDALAKAGAAKRLGGWLEAYHAAQDARAEADQMARLGYLNIEELAAADALYWRVCRDVLRKLVSADLSQPPPEQALLQEQLTDLYLCDFSLFHSIMDHWAIGQIFPVMPISRLLERPERHGTIVDLTCDSDGKISRYVTDEPGARSLPLHDYRAGEDYHIAVFLVGAYQEILGDSHNLFGRVAEVHVYADPGEPGNFYIEENIVAMTVKEMLAQVQYFPNELDRRMTELVKRKIDAGVVKPNAGMRILNQYNKLFDGTTYCDTTVARRDS